MNRAQADREARALVAEWMWAMRRTDTSWQEVYGGAEVARIDEALDAIERRFETFGPSRFHAQRAQEEVDR